jgi:hypothetical protein
MYNLPLFRPFDIRNAAFDDATMTKAAGVLRNLKWARKAMAGQF